MREYLQHHFDDNDSMSQRYGFHKSAKWPLGVPMWSMYCERVVGSNFPEISESIHLEELWVLAHLSFVLKLFFAQIQNMGLSHMLCVPVVKRTNSRHLLQVCF